MLDSLAYRNDAAVVLPAAWGTDVLVASSEDVAVLATDESGDRLAVVRRAAGRAVEHPARRGRGRAAPRGVEAYADGILSDYERRRRGRGR